jgi:hypothetical protein
LFESLGGPAVRASGFFGNNRAVVPWPSRFKSHPSHFFFHPKSGLRDIFPWNFETKFDKVQWRKSVQTLDEKKSDTAGDWTHDQHFRLLVSGRRGHTP